MSDQACCTTQRPLHNATFAWTNALERCRELVRRVYGADDEDGYERLRSLEALSVADLRRKIDAVPVDDAVSARRRDQLDAFFDATVEAAREAMLGSVTIAIRTTTCLS